MIRNNLLPESERPAGMTEVNWMRMSTVLLLILTISLGIWYFMVQMNAAEYRSQLDSILQQVNQLGHVDSELRNLRDEEGQFHQRKEDILNILDNPQYLNMGNKIELFDMVSRGMPENLWVLKWEILTRPVLIIEGVSLDYTAIGEFFKQLEENNYFQEVKLDNMRPIEVEGHVFIKYFISADIKGIDHE